MMVLILNILDDNEIISKSGRDGDRSRRIRIVVFERGGGGKILTATGTGPKKGRMEKLEKLVRADNAQDYRNLLSRDRAG